jgi:branched-chain amino acid transport system substrate-binding protein
VRQLVGQAAIGVLALCWPLQATAQEPFPAVVVNAVELSGDGAIAGNNFNNGVLLAFKEINAAGGILGRRIEVIALDTQTKPEVTRAALRKAAEMQAYAVMGPVFSDMVLAGMEAIEAGGFPAFVGAEAASITAQGNPYVFRTSLSQATSMPKLARYLKDGLRVANVAMVWVDNAFGRGGHEAMAQALAAEGIAVAADLMTAPEQRDFAEVAAKVRASGAAAAFVYLNEREAADCLRALFDEAYGGWIVGETTLAGQSVIDLAGPAANGVRAHVGLTPDALVPGIRDFRDRFLQEYKYDSDHNGMKGYTAAYVLKAATEKVGAFDPKAIAAAMRGLSLSAAEHPGVLLDVKYDDKGDLDRVSFIVRVNGRHQEMIAILPAAAGGF